MAGTISWLVSATLLELRKHELVMICSGMSCSIVDAILDFTSSVVIVSIMALPMVCILMYSSVAGSSVMREIAPTFSGCGGRDS